MDDLAIVFVAHNERTELARSLPTVEQAASDIVVVDNASRDGTAEFVRSTFPRVRVLEQADDIGYGTACNAGAAATDAPFILFLNADARPLDRALERLAACARVAGTGVTGPRLRGVDGREQPSYVGFPTRWWTGTPAFTSKPRRLRAPRRRPSSGFLVGAAFLVRREAFDAVGGFDPGFFMFYEEVDFCRRLLDAGWSLRPCAEATFEHVGGASTRREWPRMYREQVRGHLRFLEKHEGRAAAARARRYLRIVLRLRTLAARGDVREGYVAALDWLGSDGRG